MTITEALKTGKRFRRPNDAWNLPGVKYYTFSIDDLISHDWELEEKTVEITIGSFLRSYASAMKKDERPLPTGTPRLELLLRELGL